MTNQPRGKLVVPNRQIASRPDRSLVRPTNDLVQVQQTVAVLPPVSLPNPTPSQEVLKPEPSPVVAQPTKALPTIPVMQTTAVTPVQPKPLPPAKRVVDSLILPTKTPPAPVEPVLEPAVAPPQPAIEAQPQVAPPKAQADQPKKKKGFRFFNSKLSLGISLLMAGGLSGAISFAVWEVTGILMNDKASSQAVAEASASQDSDQVEVLEINGNPWRVTNQPTLAFSKTQLFEPGQVLHSQGVFWLDQTTLDQVGAPSQITAKQSGQQTAYRYKNVWQIDQLDGVASVLPAEKEMTLVGYNQTTDTWSVVVFEQI